jgi:hypothetical protein
MSSTARIGTHLVGLGIVFAAALGIGNAVEPVGPAADRTQPAVTTGGRRGAGRRSVEQERGGVRRGGAVPRSEWAGAASPRRFVHPPPGQGTDAPGVHR